jgi:hypothetical protein
MTQTELANQIGIKLPAVAMVLKAAHDVLRAVLRILHALQDEEEPSYRDPAAVKSACEMLRDLVVLMRTGTGEDEDG